MLTCHHSATIDGGNLSNEEPLENIRPINYLNKRLRKVSDSINNSSKGTNKVTSESSKHFTHSEKGELIRQCKQEIRDLLMRVTDTHDVLFKNPYILRNYIKEKLISKLGVFPSDRIKFKIMNKLISNMESKFFMKLKQDYFHMKNVATALEIEPISEKVESEKRAVAKCQAIPKFKNSSNLIHLTMSSPSKLSK